MYGTYFHMESFVVRTYRAILALAHPVLVREVNELYGLFLLYTVAYMLICSEVAVCKGLVSSGRTNNL